MATVVMNFKVEEVSGFDKKEALDNSSFTTLYRDATQSYKKYVASEKNVTDAKRKEWMIQFVEKEAKNAPGLGFVIVLEKGEKDTRNRPYHFEKVKRDGARKWKTFFKIRDAKTKEEYKKIEGNQKVAFDAAKKMLATGEVKSNLEIILQKDVIEGEAKVANVLYTPSKNCKVGRYLFFGITND